MVKWIKSFDQSDNHELADIAARCTQLNLLCLLHRLGFRIFSSVAEEAAESGNLETTKFCVKHFCGDGEGVDIAAARGGHLHILEWIITIRPKLSHRCVLAAAEKGNLEILKWLYTHGCELTEGTFVSAMESGSIKTARWCLENACPWSRSRDHILIYSSISPQMMEWYKNYTIKWLR